METKGPRLRYTRKLSTFFEICVHKVWKAITGSAAQLAAAVYTNNTNLSLHSAE